MYLVRLIYMSRFAGSLNDIKDIVDVSRKNNEKRGITGALCYDPKSFLQCLEGQRHQVNQLYNQIIADQRHTDITLLDYAYIHQRDFEKWSMAYVRVDELTESIVLKYSADKGFDPFIMSSQQALGFIKEIAREREAYLNKKQGGDTSTALPRHTSL